MPDQPAAGTRLPLEEWVREALAASDGDPRRATDELLRRLEHNPVVAATLTRASLRTILEDLVRACMAERWAGRPARPRRRAG